MTDLCQVRVAHLKLEVAFQSHVLFARKLQNYGDSFSKSSSIYIYIRALLQETPILLHVVLVKIIFSRSLISALVFRSMESTSTIAQNFNTLAGLCS